MIAWILARPFRTLLVTLIIIGELLTIGLQGTFASFVTSTTNSSSSVASGTLVLSTTSGSTQCDSWTGTNAAGNANSNCGNLAVSTGTLYPGDSSTQTFTVENEGSLAAGDLALYAPSRCSPSPGLCDVTEFYVQETIGSKYYCWYPTAASGKCTFSAYSLAGAGTLTSFTSAYSGSSADLDLTGGLGANGATRTFTLGFELPDFPSASVGNAYQGESASFSLTWYLAEGGA